MPHISCFLSHTKTTEDGGFDFYVSGLLLSGGDRPTVCSWMTLTLTPSAAVTHIGIILNEGLCWVGSTCVGLPAMTVHDNKRGALLSAHRAAAAAVRGVRRVRRDVTGREYVNRSYCVATNLSVYVCVCVRQGEPPPQAPIEKRIAQRADCAQARLTIG